MKLGTLSRCPARTISNIFVQTIPIFFGIDSQLMNQHHPIDAIVRKGESIVNFDDIFKDNWSGFVGMIRVHDDPFKLRSRGFFFRPGYDLHLCTAASIGRSVSVRPSQTELCRPDGFPPPQRMIHWTFLMVNFLTGLLKFFEIFWGLDTISILNYFVIIAYAGNTKLRVSYIL